MHYLQTIDPCGFVDEDLLRNSGFRFISYGYKTSAAIGQYNSCQIDTVSGATVTLLIDDATPYREADDTFTTSGMTFKRIADSDTAPAFAYVGYLGLEADAGPSGSSPEEGHLKNMKITIMARTADGTAAKDLATFATDMVAKNRRDGVPKISKETAKIARGIDADPHSFDAILTRYGFNDAAGDPPYPHYSRYYASDKKTWLALQFHPVDIHDRRWAEMTKRSTPAGDIYVDESSPQHRVVVLLGESYKLNYLNPSTEEKLSQNPALSVSGGASSDVNSEIALEVLKSLPT